MDSVSSLPQDPCLWRLEFSADADDVDIFLPLFEEWALSLAWEECKNAETGKITWLVHAFFQESEKTIETMKNDIICRLALAANLAGKSAPAIVLDRVPDINWVAANYQEFPALEIGRYYIYGSHLEKSNNPDHVCLQIDAATAFGSGKHGTTQGCLMALDSLAKKKSFNRPLDMGCGSGVLALAMAATWHQPVIAVDNDPEAIRVTLENAQINKLDVLIEGIISEGFDNPEVQKRAPFDLVTANILANPLRLMAPAAARFIGSHSIIILSGLLASQASEMEEIYRLSGFKKIDSIILGDWATLILESVL